MKRLQSLFGERASKPLLIAVMILFLVALAYGGEESRGELGTLAAFMAAMASAFLVLLTADYVRATQELVRETAELRKVETLPDIGIYLEIPAHSNTLVDLVVRNIGRGAAYQIQLHLDRHIGRTDAAENRHLLSDVALIRDGISYLAPNREKRIFLGPVNTIDRETFSVEVSYQGKVHPHGAVPIVETFSIDISEFDGLMYVDTPERRRTKSLEKIAKSLESIQSGRARLRVDTEPSDWEVLIRGDYRTSFKRWHERLKKALGIVWKS